MEFILRFTISHPDMDTTIVGTVNPDHLRANVEAVLKGPLAPDLYAEAKRRLGIAEPMAIETPSDGPGR
jgi:aryl-alcohol dehydrogenase-like predicted oxidoreductase